MSYKQLTENERYQIYVMKKAGHSQKAIAQLLTRSPSTISRELQRNQGLRGYRPGQAQRLSESRSILTGGYQNVVAIPRDLAMSGGVYEQESWRQSTIAARQRPGWPIARRPPAKNNPQETFS